MGNTCKLLVWFNTTEPGYLNFVSLGVAGNKSSYATTASQCKFD